MGFNGGTSAPALIVLDFLIQAIRILGSELPAFQAFNPTNAGRLQTARVATAQATGPDPTIHATLQRARTDMSKDAVNFPGAI